MGPRSTWNRQNNLSERRLSPKHLPKIHEPTCWRDLSRSLQHRRTSAIDPHYMDGPGSRVIDGGVPTCVPITSPETTISTRRFSCRPWLVLLSATGFAFPS